VPIRFTPKASTFKDQACGGASLIVTDRDALNSVDVGLSLALTLQRLYPGQFALAKLQPLLTDAPTLEAILAGKPLAEIKRGWAMDLESFKRRRAARLLYE
jgi:uncharacterized protein YbbC (DUF1343 family)